LRAFKILVIRTSKHNRGAKRLKVKKNGFLGTAGAARAAVSASGHRFLRVVIAFADFQRSPNHIYAAFDVLKAPMDCHCRGHRRQYNYQRKPMHWAKKKKLKRLLKKEMYYFAIALVCGGVLSAAHIRGASDENTLDRIQAGQWVVASMYWEDKLVSTGKTFDPIGWHAAHKTLPIGTLIRVSNPKNHRSINVTINDRGPFVADRELDLSLGAGTLLGFKGLGTVYMEVLSIPPEKTVQRRVVENLFAVNEPNCAVQSGC
jgi:rare lipoprotein A (peptidoglycan hydrolase)